MNIQNILELSKQLEVLGFHDAGSLLLKRICFNPANFYLLQRVIKEKDVLLFSLYFELLQKTDKYRMQYYDVTLQKANGGLVLPVDGVNPAELEKQMAAIEWKKAFSVDEKKQWNPDDKSTWETELKISGIMDSLSSIEQSETGKVIASALKQKFWAGTLHQEIVGPITLVKNKADVNQRFYISSVIGPTISHLLKTKQMLTNGFIFLKMVLVLQRMKPIAFCKTNTWKNNCNLKESNLIVVVNQFRKSLMVLQVADY